MAERSWETCRYALAVDGNDFIGKELKRHGLHQYYCCRNENVINGGENGGNYRTLMVTQGNETTEVAVLHDILIASRLMDREGDVKRETANGKLGVCRWSCKFYAAA